MKFLKILYLVFAASMLVDLISSFNTTQEVFRVLFWETNIWWYRIYKLSFLLLFASAFWEQQKREKLKSQ
ncbi:hypothetical protein K3G39_00335 [Pontibacter sp. HSC-14F20]|uniref:hypothetical protein n=1 Tax=Pontibacter sp. HSC-14F20 TaxID=2864136 RepID=UPI001C7351BA|nr:hypothetical protein [Pontibacter sp. HSC-14F20]MBX0331675.1 hypothetical protein [Pontibacter sp. HSC-14F20]